MFSGIYYALLLLWGLGRIVLGKIKNEGAEGKIEKG